MSSATVTTQRPMQPLQGTQARVGSRVDGHIMLGLVAVAVAAIGEHVETFDTIDHRGDGIRARIWRHDDAALTALLTIVSPCQAVQDAIAELFASKGLRPHYEEADAYEREHVQEAGAEAAGGRRSLLAGRMDMGYLLGQKLGVDVDADIHCDLLEQAYPYDGDGEGRP